MTALAYSIDGAAEQLGVSRATISRAIRAGHLKAKSTSYDEEGRATGKTVIPHESLVAYLENLGDA